MTQKAKLFKGQQNKKQAPPSRHGKALHIRKGKRNVKPSKVSKDMDNDKELTKFINHCNEVKAATMACKEGSQLTIIKHAQQSSSDSKKESKSVIVTKK